MAVAVSTGPVLAGAPVFTGTLCAVACAAPDVEPARQAAVLAGPEGLLELLCVVGDGPADAGTRVVLDRALADRALARAVAAAFEAGALPDTRMQAAPDAADALLAAAAGQDLLVLGAHDQARGAVLRRSTCPVLLARSGPRAIAFPAPLLLADDGTPSAREAARLTARLAARHDCAVHVATPGGDRRRIAADLDAIEAAGAEAHVVPVTGPAHKAIVAIARDLEASLVVVGSRGLRGLRALSSVSERVAEHAPCSVLVARPPRAGR